MRRVTYSLYPHLGVPFHSTTTTVSLNPFSYFVAFHRTFSESNGIMVMRDHVTGQRLESWFVCLCNTYCDWIHGVHYFVLTCSFGQGHFVGIGKGLCEHAQCPFW
jgi:hypothetical protein